MIRKARCQCERSLRADRNGPITVRCAVERDMQEGAIYCGQIVCQIGELKSAKEVISNIIEDAMSLVKELGVASET